MRYLNLWLKRTMDIIGSLTGLIVLLPIMLVIALLIKLISKGPVFFRQARIGVNGKTFKILKFRTMIVNAENIGDGLKIKSETDKRITTIGRFLRRYSLDELPQLVNVLLGDMSLVGPRPPATYYPYNGYKCYPDWAKKRFTMRPGITGLTQVTVRNSVVWDERIVIDNRYIDKFNIWFDIRILVATFLRVFKVDNIYFKNRPF